MNTTLPIIPIGLTWSDLRGGFDDLERLVGLSKYGIGNLLIGNTAKLLEELRTLDLHITDTTVAAYLRTVCGVFYSNKDLDIAYGKSEDKQIILAMMNARITTILETIIDITFSDVGLDIPRNKNTGKYPTTVEEIPPRCLITTEIFQAIFKIIEAKAPVSAIDRLGVMFQDAARTKINDLSNLLPNGDHWRVTSTSDVCALFRSKTAEPLVRNFKNWAKSNPELCIRVLRLMYNGSEDISYKNIEAIILTPFSGVRSNLNIDKHDLLFGSCLDIWGDLDLRASLKKNKPEVYSMLRLLTIHDIYSMFEVLSYQQANDPPLTAVCE